MVIKNHITDQTGSFGGGGHARDPSVSSDCGSERCGSEGGGDLRGMAFLPCSPMDRNSSPGGSAGLSSSSAWDSPSPRRNASSSGGGAVNASGGSGSGRPWACSPRAGGGVVPLSAPQLADVPVGSAGDTGSRGKAAASELERGRSCTGGGRDEAYFGRGKESSKVTRGAR